MGKAQWSADADAVVGRLKRAAKDVPLPTLRDFGFASVGVLPGEEMK
jgi:hypothetical protein